MKIVILVVCVLLNAVILVMFKQNGIILGGIPTALLFAAMLGLARLLSKKWDNWTK